MSECIDSTVGCVAWEGHGIMLFDDPPGHSLSQHHRAHTMKNGRGSPDMTMDVASVGAHTSGHTSVIFRGIPLVRDTSRCVCVELREFSVVPDDPPHTVIMDRAQSGWAGRAKSLICLTVLQTQQIAKATLPHDRPTPCMHVAQSFWNSVEVARPFRSLPLPPMWMAWPRMGIR